MEFCRTSAYEFGVVHHFGVNDSVVRFNTEAASGFVCDVFSETLSLNQNVCKPAIRPRRREHANNSIGDVGQRRVYVIMGP